MPHATAMLGPDFCLGDGNKVAYAIIVGSPTIGTRNWIAPHVCIGGSAQRSPRRPEFKKAGEVYHGQSIGEGTDRKRDDCYVRARANVSHDSECSAAGEANKWLPFG